ncbi:MAG: hypothetical protein R2852_04190 [Bacteroidia bacterium]
MKYIPLLLLSLLVLSFECVKDKNRDFKVLKTEKQVIYGGLPGSPVVAHYSIQVKARRDFQIELDSGWADGKIDQLFVSIDSFHSDTKAELKKGEIVNLYFDIKTESEIGGGDYQYKVPGSLDAKPPIELKKGILIRYSGGKHKYLTINDISILEPIFGQ